MSDALAGSLAEFQARLLEPGDPWHPWTERVEEARRRFADLIGADADEVAIVSCASEGAYQVASGLAWSPGDAIVTTDLEFPSIAHVWLAQRARGATVRHAVSTGGFATLDGYDQAIDERTRLVSVPLVSFRHGQRLPVAEIAALAHRRGAQVIVDAYQGLGVEPVNVAELGCDYLIGGALKYLLGIPGIAFLYARAGASQDRDPQLTGWFGRADPFSFNPYELDYAKTARRFEVGTPPVPAAYGAVAGLRLISALDPRAVREHIAALTDHLHTELARRGETIASPAAPDARGPQVAIRDTDPERLASFLAARRIMTSPRGELLRLSVHYYNTEADMAAAITAIADYRRTAP
ncbi:aminotransferase class V-fold PLP-dependent enzyme [Actinomadura craniellae]|uniref:Aminotransferase class V-fold PLP-dependent enzyme n=2 Tax=Actinomadura craniellae TaxID=2231787 RepID=A0A365HA19_9ACTN|nr:aminotransferase class V-fold PLP-dependent enzyme [Actinomadura craniellae]